MNKMFGANFGGIFDPIRKGIVSATSKKELMKATLEFWLEYRPKATTNALKELGFIKEVVEKKILKNCNTCRDYLLDVEEEPCKSCDGNDIDGYPFWKPKESV